MAKSARADAHLAFADHTEAEAASRIAEVEEIVGYHLERRTGTGPSSARPKSTSPRSPAAPPSGSPLPDAGPS
jgi:hypothetical protein